MAPIARPQTVRSLSPQYRTAFGQRRRDPSEYALLSPTRGANARGLSLASADRERGRTARSGRIAQKPSTRNTLAAKLVGSRARFDRPAHARFIVSRSASAAPKVTSFNTDLNTLDDSAALHEMDFISSDRNRESSISNSWK